MKEKAIVSTATLLASLAGYWYARQFNKDSNPYKILGAFVGSLIRQSIIEAKNKKKNM